MATTDAGQAGFSSVTNPHRLTRALWLAAVVVAACYGLFLIVTALRLPSGAELTGQFWLQPAAKATPAVLLAAAAVTHLCFLAALLPLCSPSTPRLTAGAVVVAACIALLIWFWPKLIAEEMAIPVVVYIGVLGAMVCAALLARLPTPWTALGAVCFAVSDGMIGINKFVLGSEALAVPIWWAYATSLMLITAGFFFGRTSDPSARR